MCCFFHSQQSLSAFFFNFLFYKIESFLTIFFDRLKISKNKMKKENLLPRFQLVKFGLGAIFALLKLNRFESKNIMTTNVKRDILSSDTYLIFYNAVTPHTYWRTNYLVGKEKLQLDALKHTAKVIRVTRRIPLNQNPFNISPSEYFCIFPDQ